MASLTLEEMMAMQRELQEKFAESWGPRSPESAPLHMLWLVEEVGEVEKKIKKSFILNNSCLGRKTCLPRYHLNWTLRSQLNTTQCNIYRI